MTNPNHPKPGSQIKVDPIKMLKDIKSIKKLLKDNPRDYALFIIGCNTNLRASDLVAITAGQVRTLKAEDDLVLTEQKTGKERRITLNAEGWCNQINLKGNYGSHSLQKTWGYHQRVTFGADLPTLMTCFNHSTQRQTLKYLCVQPGELKAIYQNEI